MEYRDPECWPAWAKIGWALGAAPLWIPLVMLTTLWRICDSLISRWTGKRPAHGPEGGELLQRPIEWVCALTLAGHPWQETGPGEQFCPNCQAWRWRPPGDFPTGLGER